MLRKNLLERGQQGDRYFRWRGGDVSRLEALTDGVFALSLTLLVVALEVPETFAELKQAFRMLPAFGFCFSILLYVWWSHFRFHRRYGLEDGPTVALNGLLLFLVLGYVYPLKFLFYWNWSMVLGDQRSGAAAFEGVGEIQQLMIIYSVGAFAVFGTLWLLHLWAWTKRDRLELNAVERQVTKAALAEHSVSFGLALMSIVIAASGPQYAPWAGMIYFLMPVLQPLVGWRHGVKVEALANSEQSD